jgi:hypothetical protein
MQSLFNVVAVLEATKAVVFNSIVVSDTEENALADAKKRCDGMGITTNGVDGHDTTVLYENLIWVVWMCGKAGSVSPKTGSIPG